MTTSQKAYLLLLILAALALIYFLQPILAPFLAGLALAYLFDPLVDRLETLKLNRSFSVCIVFVVFFTLVATALLVILPMLARELSALLRDIPALILWLQQTSSPWLISTFGIDPFDIKPGDLMSQVRDNWQQAGGILKIILTKVTQSSLAFLATLGSIGLTPVVAFYLMRDWDRLVARLRALVPRDHERLFVQLSTECDEVLSAFLRGQLLIMFLLGCIYSVGLYLVGLDQAILIGVLAGLISIVPYLGFVVGILAATLAVLVQFQELTPLIYVVLVFGVGQALESTLLTPWLVGDKIGMHPVVVIFAVLSGGQLFGFVGILLALPIAAVSLVFVRHLHKRYVLSAYYQKGEYQKGEYQKGEQGE